jgi:hypothetical protein
MTERILTMKFWVRGKKKELESGVMARMTRESIL